MNVILAAIEPSGLRLKAATVKKFSGSYLKELSTSLVIKFG